VRTAIVAFYEAYPPMSGAAAVSYNLAKFLPGKKTLVQMGQRASAASIEGIRVITLAGFSESRSAKLLGLSGKIRRMVAEVVTFRPDTVVLEGASWALYHRILLWQLRRALPHEYIVYHSHNVEYNLRSHRSNGAIAALTRWAEGSLLHDVDLPTAVSPIDQQQFTMLYGVKPALLPNGVDIERFAGLVPSATAQARSAYGIGVGTLLFSGFYGYPPNREAVDFLVNLVMPALRKRFRWASLAVTGGGAPYHDSWIRNVGSLPYEDFAAFVAACGIAVAPIFSGSGTRLKVLEAMAAGLPVVATEKAVEGLGLSPGEHFLVASNAGEFLDAIARLFEEPALAAHLRAAARTKISEFSWEGITRSLEQLIGPTKDENRRHSSASWAG